MGNSSSKFVDHLSQSACGALSHVSGHDAYMAAGLRRNVNDRPRLPNELFDMVVDNLTDDQNTLSALCQVHSYFVKQTRDFLFRSIKVKSPPKTFEQFCEFLDAHPELATLVQELSLVASVVDEHGRTVPMGQEAVLPSDLLYNILKNVPNPRSLSLVGVRLRATALLSPRTPIHLDYLAVLDPVADHTRAQDYYSTFVPFVKVGTLCIKKFAYPGFHLNDPTMVPGWRLSDLMALETQALPSDFPLLLTVTNVELNAPDITGTILRMLAATTTVNTISSWGTSLRSLDISCHDTLALFQFTRGSCSTLERFKFDLSGWLAVEMRDGHINQLLTTSIGEELNLHESCPNLQSVTLRLAVNEIKKVPEETFASIASILERIPQSVSNVVLDIDLGGHAAFALEYLGGDDLQRHWQSLGAVELASLHSIDFEFRRAVEDVSANDLLERSLALRLSGMLNPADVSLGFIWETHDYQVVQPAAVFP